MGQCGQHRPARQAGLQRRPHHRHGQGLPGSGPQTSLASSQPSDSRGRDLEPFPKPGLPATRPSPQQVEMGGVPVVDTESHRAISGRLHLDLDGIFAPFPASRHPEGGLGTGQERSGVGDLGPDLVQDFGPEASPGRRSCPRDRRGGPEFPAAFEEHVVELGLLGSAVHRCDAGRRGSVRPEIQPRRALGPPAVFRRAYRLAIYPTLQPFIGHLQAQRHPFPRRYGPGLFLEHFLLPPGHGQQLGPGPGAGIGQPEEEVMVGILDVGTEPHRALGGQPHRRLEEVMVPEPVAHRGQGQAGFIRGRPIEEGVGAEARVRRRAFARRPTLPTAPEHPPFPLCPLGPHEVIAEKEGFHRLVQGFPQSDPRSRCQSQPSPLIVLVKSPGYPSAGDRQRHLPSPPFEEDLPRQPSFLPTGFADRLHAGFADLEESAPRGAQFGDVGMLWVLKIQGDPRGSRNLRTALHPQAEVGWAGLFDPGPPEGRRVHQGLSLAAQALP